MPSNAVTEIPTKPSWFDIKVAWNAPLPDLPSFVSLSWVERWHGLDSTALRRLHAAVSRSRDNLIVGTWWPQAVPTLSEVPFLLARTMREPAAFAELVRAYALEGMRPAAEPSTLLVTLRKTYREADTDGRLDILECQNFADLLEDPDKAKAEYIGLPSGEGGLKLATPFFTDPLLASLLAWMRVHFPESAAAIDERKAWTPGADVAKPAPAVSQAPAAQDAVEEDAGGESPVAKADNDETAVVAQPAPVASDEAVPPAQDHPVPEPTPYVEAEAAGIELDIRTALAEVSQHALLALQAETPLRASVHPVILAAQRAARGARTLERYLQQPLDASGILDSLTVSSLRVADATHTAPGHVPAPPFFVARPAFPRLDALAKDLHGSASDIHGLFESLDAKARAMVETKDYSLAGDLAEAQVRIKAQGVGFVADLQRAVAELEGARYVAPVQSPRLPKPAAVPVAAAPSAEPVRTRPVAAARPAAPAEPAHPVEVLASTVLDLGAYDEKTFKAALSLCMAHLSDGFDFPEDPVHSPVFSRGDKDGADGKSVRTSLVGSGDTKTWAAVRHEDHEEKGRRMSLEITLQAAEGALRLGIQVSTSAASGDFKGERTATSLIGDVVAGLPCTAGPIPLSAKPVELTVQNAQEMFDTYVLAPRRRLPVVAISLDKDNKSNLVDINELATALSGLAHVLVVPLKAATAITTLHSKKWSVFNGAVRIYWTKVNTENDDSTRHPMTPPDLIGRMNANHKNGEAPFESSLVQTILREGAQRFAQSGLPSVGQVEAMMAEAASGLAEDLAYVSDDAGLAEIYAQETDAANRRATDALNKAEGLEVENLALKDERDDSWSRNAHLAARVESLTAALTLRNATGVQPAAPAAPATIEEICAFAETDMGSHVIVVSKAIKETRKSTNLNVALLYEGLLLLRDFYVPYRRGLITRERFETVAKGVRYEECECFADKNTDRYNGYTADWNGHTYKLNRHLKLGNKSGTDIAIRIYFHYDENTQVVIVGHMPTHLRNNLTN